MAKKKKNVENTSIDIVKHIKSMNIKETSKNIDVNEILAEVLKLILNKIDTTTNLNQRNVRPISILECVPIWKDIVRQLVGNLPHLKNDLKNTLKELFLKLSEAIQNNQNNELEMLLKQPYGKR